MAKYTGADSILKKLRVSVILTRAGMVAEQAVRCFWPLTSIVLASLALLMLGLQDMVSVELVWGLAALATTAGLFFLVRGARQFRWPSRAAALTRLDETLHGRPIQALMDDQAIGSGDAQSAAVWHAHQARMAARAQQARPARPDLRVSRHDPYALRYVALIALVIALLFGSFWRVGSVGGMAPGLTANAATGPSWEGWVEPPRYTGHPTLYLNDLTGPDLNIPQGSKIILRFYGEVGALSLSETISDRPVDAPAPTDQIQEFLVAQNGTIQIQGDGGREWNVLVVQDKRPVVSVLSAAEPEAMGQMSLPFQGQDDYGVVAGEAVIELDLGAVDRRYGLAVMPEPRQGVNVPLPMPIAGDRTSFTEKLLEDFSKHPWANLPVTFTLSVTDAAGQTGLAEPIETILPARRFFDPMAAAVIEQRRDLLWSRDNAPRIAQLLRAISHRPDDVFRSETAYLRLRFILRRLETMAAFDLKPEHQEEIAEALWELAVLIEDGDLGDALERLRRAQERLTEAMKNGASDQEIAELMQELREATNDYMRQLSRQARENGEILDKDNLPENLTQLGQDDLQKMMDRIQELMEQGRMAEAQQALQELQEMMDNMRISNAPGQGGQSEGQQAMEGLADTLREQQGLSDQAFRDLQEQFNPDAQAGQSQGNQGRNGGQGQGESHEGQGGQGQGQGEGQTGQGQEGQGAEQDGQGGGGLEESLAQRQRSLRQELENQQRNLPGGGTPEGDAARDALDRAGRAMEGAEESLRRENLADAIDKQSEAMEALREGMRSLGEAMAQEQQMQPGQGQQQGDQSAQGTDPLGREDGTNGANPGDGPMGLREDVYRRARDLLDEIHRRSGEGERPQLELEYLERLLERF